MEPSELDDLFEEGTNLEDNNTQKTQAEDEMSDGGSAADELEIQKLLSADPAAGGLGLNLDSDRPIDQSGKADDAVDYEDVSDDDLPDEEPATVTSGDGPGLTDDGGTPNDADDLFGEDDDNPSSYDIFDHPDKGIQNGTDPESFDTALTLPSPPSYDINFDPAPAEGSVALSRAEKIERAKAACPQFDPDAIPFINEWFRSKQAYYRPKTDPKPPKPLTHPKISLDIAPDQERAFRSAGTSFTSSRAQRLEEAAARGITLDLEPVEEVVEIDQFDYTPLDENAIVTSAGATVADLRLALTDFNSCLDDYKPPAADAEPTEEDEWMAEYGGRVNKKPRLSDFSFIDQPVYQVPSFNNFEELTAQIGFRVILDLNDPEILIAPVEEQHSSKKRLLNGSLKHGASAKNPLSRFNFSNDHAYEALRANNLSKVRAAIGSVAVEHSMVAMKCVWPYYKVKRTTPELRAFHRMPLKFKQFLNKDITFAKSTIRKKKNMKGLSTRDIYAKTSDLSLSDNSTAMLLEYSEEIPTVLSNFGMGNRVINYYRRINDEDAHRPQKDVGEIQILQPADESPFSRFGKVDPGETVVTLHNSMYRAPIYKHEPKPNDFLAIRSTTGADGTSWHLRNIDHLYVVGQELPSIEVPGPHSRRVTNATRNRMAMVSFRLIKKSKNQDVKISEVTRHIEDSTDMQNRQKLKEFLKYDKESKVWKLKEDHEIPPLPLMEEGIRALIKPEDVCLIDAMQMGLRQLADAGYGQTDAHDEDQATGSLEQQLAPWRTTKAFLEASTGKAMLTLTGPGDPSGMGIALSMIKTSMKGGFIKNLQGGPMGTSADAMERQKRANGGHDYNVHEQEAKYNEVLDKIWTTQQQILKDPIEHTEDDEEDLHTQEEQRLAQISIADAGTPANCDDSASVMSDYRSARVLRITRQWHNEDGEIEESHELITDPRVARAYAKRRAAKDAENIDIYDIQPTGDPEADKAKRRKAQEELARLTRNKERREHRERMKLKKNAGDRENDSPTPATPGPSDLAGASVYGNTNGNTNGNGAKEKGKKAKTIPGTTARKCANCGASGHIKTNRKLCPMLNGEWPGGVQPDGWTASLRGGGRNNTQANDTAAPSVSGTNGVYVGSVNGMNSTSALASTSNLVFDHQNQNGEENSNGFHNGNGNGVGMDLHMDMGMDMDMDMGLLENGDGDMDMGLDLGMEMEMEMEMALGGDGGGGSMGMGDDDELDFAL